MIWIKNLFSNPRNRIILGRWKIHHDEKILGRIVYLANEDHCGCCEIKEEFTKENICYYTPFCL